MWSSFAPPQSLPCSGLDSPDTPLWNPGGAGMFTTQSSSMGWVAPLSSFMAAPLWKAQNGTGTAFHSLLFRGFCWVCRLKAFYAFFAERTQGFSSPEALFYRGLLRHTAALSTEVDPSLACAPFSSDAVRLVYKLKTPLSFQTTKNLEEYQW